MIYFKNPKISEKSHGGFCYIQVACLRTDTILFNLLDRWSSWHSHRFRRVWVLSGQAEPRTLGTQGGDEGFCWRVWGVETSWIWDLAIKYMCFLDWDHDFSGDKWLIINKWDAWMTWVCLKMMYTPSSWKVFHRDRIFLNQSMLGVTLCSDKAISGWWFGTMEFYDFPYIGNFIIPTDELIFFRGVGLPPTIYIYIHNAWQISTFVSETLSTQVKTCHLQLGEPWLPHEWTAALAPHHGQGRSGLLLCRRRQELSRGASCGFPTAAAWFTR